MFLYVVPCTILQQCKAFTILALLPFPTVNKAKIYYGLLKEPEIPNLAIEEEEGEEEGDKPKKKKPKKDALQKSKKNDPNAPPGNRIPLPEL